jgi:plasmid stabilization system protein ParE
MRLLWYSDAAADLDEIYDYYVTLNPRNAAMLYNSILDDSEILCTHPCIAPIEPLLKDLPEKYRSLIVAKGRYKLVYYIENESVFVVQVFACQRNYRRLRSTTLMRNLNQNE